MARSTRHLIRDFRDTRFFHRLVESISKCLKMETWRPGRALLRLFGANPNCIKAGSCGSERMANCWRKDMGKQGFAGGVLRLLWRVFQMGNCSPTEAARV